MLTKLFLVIISQYIVHISNSVIYLILMQCYMSIMSQINRREKECVQGHHKSRCVSCLNILTRADLGKNKQTNKNKT